MNRHRQPTSLMLPGLLALATVGSVACSTQPSPAAGLQVPLAGADRDAHGCIGSAGYLWCASEGSCARPWELSAERGFPPGAEAFAAHCDGGLPAPAGL